MSTAILQAEVQARIDALVYPVPTTELLQNAVDTVGLGLDLTNIISVLNSSTAAITSSTPDDDVTALNAASIALGVTSKGGSGVLKQESRVSSDIPAGASGDVLTIPATEGKLIKICTLMTTTNNTESDMTLSLGGVIYSAGFLAAGAGYCDLGSFGVCGSLASTLTTLLASGYSSEIVTDGDVVLTKASGATSNAIRYAYEIVRI